MPKRIRSADNQMNRYLNGLRKAGYVVTMNSGSGHWKIYLDGKLVTSTSASPSCYMLPKLRKEVENRTREIQGDSQAGVT